MYRTPTKVEKGPASTDAQKSSRRVSSAKKKSLIVKKVTKSATSRSNIVKSDDKREKPEQVKKDKKKDNEKLSPTTSKEEQSEGDDKNRKEGNEKSEPSKDESKQADKKKEVKTKQIQEDPEVIKKMFGDDTKIVRHLVSKEDNDKASREEMEKTNKIMKPESSKFKRDKMDYLFNEKPQNRKEAAFKIKIEQPSSASSTTNQIPVSRTGKPQKRETKNNAETSTTSRPEKKKTAASAPPSLVPKDVSSKKIAARSKVNDKHSNGAAEKKIIDQSLVEVQAKQQPVKRKLTKPVAKKETSTIPAAPEESIKEVVVQRKWGSSSSPATTTVVPFLSLSSSSSSSDTSKRVSPRNATAAVKKETKPVNPYPAQKKEKSICKIKEDGSTIATSSRRKTPEDGQNPKKKRTVTPLIKRKRTSTPDADLRVAVTVDSIASTTADSKKVKVELPDLSLFTPEYLSQLVELHQKIGSLSDKLQRIMDVVKSSGIYEFSETTFDFDLCALDSETIRQIQQCLT